MLVDSRLARVPGLLQRLGAARSIGIVTPDEPLAKQIQTILGGQTSHDAIHVVASVLGSDLYLGAQALNSADLAGSSDALRALGAALAADGAVLLFGCELTAADDRPVGLDFQMLHFVGSVSACVIRTRAGGLNSGLPSE